MKSSIDPNDRLRISRQFLRNILTCRWHSDNGVNIAFKVSDLIHLKKILIFSGGMV